MIQSEETSHFKLSQIEERSRKASRHETIRDETETISTIPRPRHEISNFGLETDHVSRPNIPEKCNGLAYYRRLLVSCFHRCANYK